MNQKRQGLSRTPAPIFAKKPRQALLAHPNNSSSTNDQRGSYLAKNGTKSAPNSLGREPSNQNSANNYRVQQSYNPKNDHYNPMESSGFTSSNFGQNQYGNNIIHMQEKFSSGPNYASHNYQPANKSNQQSLDFQSVGNSFGSNRAYQQQQHPTSSVTHTSQYGNNRSSVKELNQHKMGSYTQQQHSLTYNTQIKHEMFKPQHHQQQQSSLPYSSSFTQMQETPHYNQRPSQQFMQYGSTPNSNNILPVSSSPARGGQPYGRPVTPDGAWNFSKRKLNTASVDGGNSGFGYQISNKTQQSNGYPGASNKVKKPGNEIKSSDDFKTEKKECDNSLRILTANVNSMKNWATYTQRVPLIFEVFGILNTAVTSLDGCTKEFSLKDEKDIARCIFYQIDRDLPRLVRGQWYRCVGKWATQLDCFHCLSMRLATDEERKVYKLKINASDKAIRAWRSKHNEF